MTPKVARQLSSYFCFSWQDHSYSSYGMRTHVHANGESLTDWPAAAAAAAAPESPAAAAAAAAPPGSKISGSIS